MNNSPKLKLKDYTVKAKNRFDLNVIIQRLERDGYTVTVDSWWLNNMGVSTGDPVAYRAYKHRDKNGYENTHTVLIYP